MKKMISVLVILLFSWFVYYQCQLMQELRDRNNLIYNAVRQGDNQFLLDMEKTLAIEVHSEKWGYQFRRSQYVNILYYLRKFDKIIDEFDAERQNINSIRSGIAYMVCMSRYKLNRNGNECAEDVFVILRQQPNYYDNLEYWLFVVLAEKQSDAANDIDKVKLFDRNFLREFISNPTGKEDIIRNY